MKSARTQQPPTFDDAVKLFYANMQRNADITARRLSGDATARTDIYTVNKVGGCYEPIIGGTRRTIYFGYEVHLESHPDGGLLEESFTFPFVAEVKSLDFNYSAHDHPDANGVMQRPSTLLYSMHDGVGPFLCPIFLPANDVGHHPDHIVFPRLQRIKSLHFATGVHGFGGRFEIQIVGRG